MGIWMWSTGPGPGHGTVVLRWLAMLGLIGLALPRLLRLAASLLLDG